jgi:hypothetical protein
MTTREEALVLIRQTVDNNAELTSFLVRLPDVKSKFDRFSDSTLLDLADAFRNDRIAERVAHRVTLLLSTTQQKSLEYVVRNIILFADVERYYTQLMNISTRKQWKTFAVIEAYARRRVCGEHPTIETAEQRKQMVAIFHGVFALARHFMTESKMEYCDGFVTKYVMRDVYQYPLQHELLDVFQNNPDQSARLFDFVADRGPVEKRLLEAVIFFGDDELPSSLFSGVL